MSVRLRLVAALVGAAFLLCACGGGGGGRASLGGSVPGSGSGPASQGHGNVQFTLTIPGSATTSSSNVRRPQTVSPQTQSLTVSVNGGAPQAFNATSPTCTGTNPITCTITVGAPYGLDSFLIITYSGASGTGTALNAAAVTVSVTSGGTNTASATAGNILTVDSATDASGGSYSCASGSTTCTLREAVAEASTTAGVYTAIMFQGVTTLTLTSKITIGSSGAQNIILIGPGATAANSAGVGAPQASSGLTISGGNATQIFYVEQGSLTVDGLTLANGSSNDDEGGAIENYGTLAIVNTILSGNGGSDTYDGGAVYDQSSTNDTTTVIASTFTNNTALEYGGAYDDEDGASFSNCVFTNNSAYTSGGEDLEGGAILADYDLFVNASTFTGNVAGSTTQSTGVDGYGGAISIEDNDQSPTITNSTFGGSTSTANFAGGAGATDYGEGGAIYNDGYYPLTLSGNTFANNTAKGGESAYGGAISDYLGITSNGDTFSNNVADATASTDSEDDIDAIAGAVASEYSPLSLTGDTFSGNQAKGPSGASAPYGQAYGAALAFYTCCSGGADIAIASTTFSNNASTAGYYCEGGAIDDEDYYGPGSLTLSSVQITGNSCTANNGTGYDAESYGGAMYVEYDHLGFSTVTFSGNTASSSQTSPSYYAESYGGGLMWEDGDSTGDESIARRLPPGAVRVSRSGPTQQSILAAHQKRIAQAATRHQSARASLRVHPKSKHFAASLQSSKRVASKLRIQQVSSTSWQNVSFTGNTATSSGYEPYAEGGGAVLSGNPAFSGVSFGSNTASISGTYGSAYGGGFSYDYGCGAASPTITVTVTGNTASNGGGGATIDCSGMTLLSSTFSGNSVAATGYAADGGGAISNYSSGLTLSGSTVTGNFVAGSQAGSGGGGILNLGSLTILNSTIYANSSAIDGGGVEGAFFSCCDGYTEGSTIALVNATIYANVATGAGGNINNQAGGGSNVVSSQNTIIAGGTAASGSDIYNLDTFTSLDYNLVQQSANYGPGTSNAPLAHDKIGVSPVLGALANNGGPTSTLSDSGSSPGKGYIPFGGGLCNGAAGTAVDQRGYLRGAGGVCDIGAYEFAGVAGGSP